MDRLSPSKTIILNIFVISNFHFLFRPQITNITKRIKSVKTLIWETKVTILNQSKEPVNRTHRIKKENSFIFTHKFEQYPPILLVYGSAF